MAVSYTHLDVYKRQAAMERQPVQPGSAAGAEVRAVSAMDRMRRQTQEAVRPR